MEGECQVGLDDEIFLNRIDDHGRVYIPLEIRLEMGINAGDEVGIIQTPDSIIIVPGGDT